MAAIVQAIGLRVTDLFPSRISVDTAANRRAHQHLFQQVGWRAALEVLAKEAFVVSAAGSLISNQERLSDEDLARLATALDRIDDAKVILSGR